MRLVWRHVCSLPSGAPKGAESQVKKTQEHETQCRELLCESLIVDCGAFARVAGILNSRFHSIRVALSKFTHFGL